NFMFLNSTILGVETKNEFLFFLGILVMVILVTSLLFKAVTMIVQIRFTSMCQYRISKRFVEGYLNQPYSWILNRHSADLGKTVLSEVNVVISKGLKPMITLITQSAVILTLISLLVLVNPKPAIIIGVIFGLAYFIIYSFIKNLLTKIGEERLKANEMRFTTIIEAFGAFKELKISQLEKAFVQRFSDHAKIFSKHQASAQIIPMLPRFFLEAIAFGGMLLVVLYLMRQNNAFDDALPLITLYVFAGYRLLPAFQIIYSSIAQMRLVGPSLNSVHDDMKNLNPYITEKNEKRLPLNKVIELDKINFQYPNSSKIILKDINIIIPANKKIGLVGTTGSGKTTIIDIILGLLEPKSGLLKVDNEIINKNNIRAWQKSVGYVPQQIYLSDDTVAANIAFGIDPNNINKDAVEKAAKIANLHNFVINEMPNKYETTLGERGIRLSGGQRQRIGIARALYHNPKFLILDEATSSLDNITEKV
ncbi:ABC transporter ATP-binding protein/permease, partial [Candidatus Pelagibacter ubique]|nr:ABC transporter ATP-binding protein/permease [Candidatus Pelagibacter ubique]